MLIPRHEYYPLDKMPPSPARHFLILLNTIAALCALPPCAAATVDYVRDMKPLVASACVRFWYWRRTRQ